MISHGLSASISDWFPLVPDWFPEPVETPSVEWFPVPLSIDREPEPLGVGALLVVEWFPVPAEPLATTNGVWLGVSACRSDWGSSTWR